MGLLQQGKAIFYHPLDDLGECIESEAWTKASGDFSAAKVGDGLSTSGGAAAISGFGLSGDYVPAAGATKVAFSGWFQKSVAYSAAPGVAAIGDGATSVSGTGVNGSTVEVFVDGESVGNADAPVSGGAWAKTGMSALETVVTAKQTEPGKLQGPASGAVTVGEGPAVCVEEDWKLVLNEPDPYDNSPQIYTLMSPQDQDSFFFDAFWNWREDPPGSGDFVWGGVQLRGWLDQNQEYSEDHSDMAGGQLNVEGETITWTQRMATDPDGGALSFEVVNGQSVTWETFGTGDGLEKISIAGADLPDLSSYDPGYSAAHSFIAYGGNRVEEFVITQVRCYSAAGLLISVDVTQRSGQGISP